MHTFPSSMGTGRGLVTPGVWYQFRHGATFPFRFSNLPTGNAATDFSHLISASASSDIPRRQPAAHGCELLLAKRHPEYRPRSRGISMKRGFVRLAISRTSFKKLY